MTDLWISQSSHGRPDSADLSVIVGKEQEEANKSAKREPLTSDNQIDLTMSLESFVLRDLNKNNTSIRRPSKMSRKTSENLITGAGRPFTLATKIGSAAGILLGMIIVLLPGYFAYNAQLFILPAGDLENSQFATYANRLAFTAKYWVLPLSWLVINCHLVVLGRVMGQAINPLSENEHLVEAIKNVFTNSIEQFLLSAAAQIILIVYLTEQQVNALIPLINLLHLIGRIFYWLFYPRLRSFGFILTFLPTNIALGYGIFMLFAAHVGTDIVKFSP